MPDEPWAYGKSGLKALQYAALGIHTVATALAANYRVVKDGETGFLVRTDAEWLEKLIRLIDDPGLRQQMGCSARTHVEDHYSVHANRRTYRAILEHAANSH